jgi:hypothetical protein
MKVTKGVRDRRALYSNNGSIVLTIPKPFAEYAGFKAGDTIVLVCDQSPKYGRFIGLGLPKEPKEESK